MSASMQPSTSTQLTSAPLQASAQTVNSPLNVRAKSFTPKGQPGGGRGVRCFNCRQQGHYARDCLAPKRESSGPGSGGSDQDASARQVYSQEDGTSRSVAARDVLYSSDSDGGEIQTVRVEDRGSKPRHASVQVEGVPAEGVIDTGADITIIGGDLFRRVAAVARLKKNNFKEADKIPRTYDQRPFSLDGKIDMNITFDGMTMRTPVYVKLDAPEQLLLSEGVCRQLRIITYHPEVLIKKQSSGTQARGGQTQSREVPRKGEPELRMETVRQQRDAPSLTPDIRKDQSMDVVQSKLELPSSDRKVKLADRGDCQSANSQEQGPIERRRSDELKSLKWGEQTSQDERNAIVTVDQKTLGAQSEICPVAEVVDGARPGGPEENQPATRQGITEDEEYGAWTETGATGEVLSEQRDTSGTPAAGGCRWCGQQRPVEQRSISEMKSDSAEELARTTSTPGMRGAGRRKKEPEEKETNQMKTDAIKKSTEFAEDGLSGKGFQKSYTDAMTARSGEMGGVSSEDNGSKKDKQKGMTVLGDKQSNSGGKQQEVREQQGSSEEVLSETVAESEAGAAGSRPRVECETTTTRGTLSEDTLETD